MSNTVVRFSTLRRASVGALFRILDTRSATGLGASAIEYRPSEMESPSLRIGVPVLAEDCAHGVGNLSDGGVRLDRGDHPRHQVVTASRGGADRVEGRTPRRLVAR